MKLIPKNWRDFQHYKDRNPPWIRLHRKLLDDRDFHRLPVESRALAPMLWLLAAETVDGVINGSHDELAFRLRTSEREIAKALAPLIDRGFFEKADGEMIPASAKNVAEYNGFSSRHVSDNVKREVWARDSGKCCTCQSEEHIEYDHKVPVSQGGTSDADNIWLLCRSCNRKKRAKTAEQFATQVQTTLESRTSESESESESEASPPDAHAARKAKPRRSSRAPEDFQPDLAMAVREIPDIDAAREVQKFRDWEFKTPRSDWPAVWRNWVETCRESGKYARVKTRRTPNGLEVFRPV